MRSLGVVVSFRSTTVAATGSAPAYGSLLVATASAASSAASRFNVDTSSAPCVSVSKSARTALARAMAASVSTTVGDLGDSMRGSSAGNGASGSGVTLNSNDWSSLSSSAASATVMYRCSLAGKSWGICQENSPAKAGACAATRPNGGVTKASESFSVAAKHRIRTWSTS